MRTRTGEARRNPLCPRCAAPTTGGRFCGQCGAELGSPTASEVPRSTPLAEQPDDPVMLHGPTVAIARDPWPLGPTPGTTDVVVTGHPEPSSTTPPAAGAPRQGVRPSPPPPPELAPAEPGLRLVARLVDGVILLVPLLGIAGLVLQAVRGDLGTTTTLVLVAVASVLLLVVVGYEPVLVAARGATPGKMTVGLRVVRARDGGLPGGGQSLLRALVPWGLGVPTAGLGAAVVYASVLLDPAGTRRGWHDRVAGTRVVVHRTL